MFCTFNRLFTMELSDLESHLHLKYPSLQIVNKSDYLHLWIPFRQKSLQFLPLFHAIVTLHNEEVRYRLFTYHGRKIQESVQKVSSIQQNIGNSICDNMKTWNWTNLGLCQGISPHKVADRRNLIHEPLIDKIVYRSQECKYAIQLPNSVSEREITMSCLKCSGIKHTQQQHFSPNGNKDCNRDRQIEQGAQETICVTKDMIDHTITENTNDCDVDYDSDTPLSHLLIKGAKPQFNAAVEVKEDMENKEDKLESAKAEEVYISAKIGEGKPCLPRIKNNLLARLPSSVEVVLSQKSRRPLVKGLESMTINHRSHPKHRSNGTPNNKINISKTVKRTDSHRITDQKPRIKFNPRESRAPRFITKPRDNHQRSSNAEVPNNCEICLRYFKVPDWRHMCLIRHKQALNINMNITCPVCNEEGIPKLRLTSHFAVKHSDLRSTCCCECLEVIKMPDLKHGDELRKHILEK